MKPLPSNQMQKKPFNHVLICYLGCFANTNDTGQVGMWTFKIAGLPETSIRENILCVWAAIQTANHRTTVIIMQQRPRILWRGPLGTLGFV